jgi:hypothetical protein
VLAKQGIVRAGGDRNLSIGGWGHATQNTLIGAIVGGLIGIGVLIAAFMFFEVQHTALAIVVAVLVGLGVRSMVSTKGHASYLRGALTALVAVAAFVGGNIVVAKVAQSQLSANASKPMNPTPLPERSLESATEEVEVEEAGATDTAEAAGDEATDADAAEAEETPAADGQATDEQAAEATSEPVAAETMEAVEIVQQTNLPMGKGMRGPQKSDYRPMDFILFSVAMLIAYELGRGSGTGAITAAPEATATA